jgi:hypothetical protein
MSDGPAPDATLPYATFRPITVSLLAPDGERHAGTIVLSQGRQAWDRSLDFSSANLREHHVEESDWFNCLIALRRMLEAHGWRILCNGARPNVWPSGMSRSMGGGALAYAWPREQRTLGPEDLVNIFDEASPEQIVAVDEHLDNFRDFRGVLTGTVRPPDRPRPPASHA